MRAVSHIACAALLLTIGMITAVQAAPPRLISYQGYLKDAAGVPVNGSVNMSLRLYDTAKEGTPLWIEKRDVLITNGLYQLDLGEVTPFNLPFDQPYWLGIIINGDPELQPRQQLSYSPYAFRSTVAETVPDKSVTAVKIGQVCADGEVLRYDSQTSAWRCNPTAGGFPASLPMVGALTVQGITTSTVSPNGPDPQKDIILYGFDLQFTSPAGGKIAAGPLKVVCEPKKFAPIMTQSIAMRKLWTSAALWLKGSDALYASYIELDDVTVTSVKPVPPSRPGEPTLVEYTLAYQVLRFISPSNPNQKATLDPKVSIVGCTHPNPVFSVTHGLPVDLGSLFGTVYPVSSYSYTVDAGSPLGRPLFSDMSVSGPLGNDGPCFMTDLIGRHYQSLTIYTAAPQSAAGNILLESRVMLTDVFMNSYRLYTSAFGVIQQDMSFQQDMSSALARIYWGYYPINADTGNNDPIVEKGWNIGTSTPL